MKLLFSAWLITVLFTWSAQAQSPNASDDLTKFEEIFAAPAPQNSSLALTLDEVERVALAANPEIAVAVRRVAVAEAHVPVAGALDDPSAMYRGWSVPLTQPWNYNDAQNMFSVSQTLPGAGKRALRTGVAQSDVDVAKAQLDEVRLTVRVQVRKAFDDLLLACLLYTSPSPRDA